MRRGERNQGFDVEVRVRLGEEEVIHPTRRRSSEERMVRQGQRYDSIFEARQTAALLP